MVRYFLNFLVPVLGTYFSYFLSTYLRITELYQLSVIIRYSTRPSKFGLLISGHPVPGSAASLGDRADARSNFTFAS